MAGDEGQALTDVQLVLRMNILGIPMSTAVAMPVFGNDRVMNWASRR